MMWAGVQDDLEARRPELEAELEAAERRGPGSVEYSPSFRLPDYFSRVDYHLQPGGYYADPLAGFVYHYGTKVFFTGKNNNDDVQRELVFGMPLPPDGHVDRVLDLACSVGQSTTAFKERFPSAEVWGIDAGAPMVRYAHKRAVEMGVPVRFAQRLAEETGFPNEHFDVVFAYILFHEVPESVAPRIVAEAHRVLRPGGVFVVVDVRNQDSSKATPAQLAIWDYETRDNGEPYMSEYIYSDFNGLLRRTFSSLNEDALPATFLPMRVAVK
jgi:ubiquinone/menaquinone biosynthesis C-methylase UbiE